MQNFTRYHHYRIPYFPSIAKLNVNRGNTPQKFPCLLAYSYNMEIMGRRFVKQQ